MKSLNRSTCKNCFYFPLFCVISPCSPVNESIAFIYICHSLHSIGGWSISKDDLLCMWCHFDGISFQNWDLFTATQTKVIRWVRIYNIVVLFLWPDFLSLKFVRWLKGEVRDIFWEVMPLCFSGSKFTQVYENKR